MQGYLSKKELIDEINKRAVLFINEFSEITDENKDTFVDEVDKSPVQMIAYQLGWMNLILLWEEKNKNDETVITPSENYKWNNLGGLYQSFYKKYENEIKQNNNAYTENFIGSSALRDYDGVKDFQHSYPTKNEIINPFQNYVYIEGILFARIIWEIGEFLIPPFQKIISKDGSYKFPLREICELKNNSSGNPICYYLPFDEKKYLHKIN